MGTFGAASEPLPHGTVRIRLAGELDIAAADPLLEILSRVVRADGVSRVLVDLSAVTFLDAAGVGLLLTAYNAATGQGRGLRVCGARGIVQEILEITGVQGVLRAKADPDHFADPAW